MASRIRLVAVSLGVVAMLAIVGCGETKKKDPIKEDKETPSTATTTTSSATPAPTPKIPAPT